MVEWNVQFKKTAMKDSTNLKAAGLKEKAEKVLAIIKADPYRTPPPCEKLIGDLAGYYSRRINRKHRIVYAVQAETYIVIVYRMFSHYGE